MQRCRPTAVPFVLDVLPMIAGFVAGKSDGNEGLVTIHTTGPDQSFELAVGPEQLALAPAADAAPADIELSAEELIRLVYGRLDPAHTSASAESPVLDRLRKLFPGV